MVDTDDVDRLRQLAGILFPGDDRSPAADSVADIDGRIRLAVTAIGSEGEVLRLALDLLPAELDWASVKDFAESHTNEFELLAVVAAGAYFMAPAALAAIGYPQGPRKAARIDQIVDELETGVLDLVMQRESMVRKVPV